MPLHACTKIRQLGNYYMRDAPIIDRNCDGSNFLRAEIVMDRDYYGRKCPFTSKCACVVTHDVFAFSRFGHRMQICDTKFILLALPFLPHCFFFYSIEKQIVISIYT